ncbi:MAG: hypothetical protein SF187_30875 [Deltaproteobacteria bacterium]|nr:hypothetical protein [Deltaproteobacteria bacterium]
MRGFRCVVVFAVLVGTAACTVKATPTGTPGPVDGGQVVEAGVPGRPDPVACDPSAVLKDVAESCTCNAECGTGRCVDGVCCASACDGLCEACNVPGKVGACAPIPAGLPPVVAGQCKVDDVSTCGFDGTCNGNRGCRKYPEGTACKKGICDGATVKGEKVCRLGQCTVGPDTVCSPFGCDPAKSACFETCTDDGQCSASQKCASGSCGLRNIGAKCGGNTECESGFCADGVCCNTACDDACVTCNQLLTKGECRPVMAEQPDPHNVCKDEGAATCGQSGSCDGQGGCAKYSASTPCRAARCEGANAIPASTCDGKGSCLAASQVACAPFACSGNACKTTCNDDTDCSGAVCINNSCGLRGKGQNCTAASQCASGFCSDGVCCDSACTGQCKYCASAQARGSCVNVAADTADPRAAGANPSAEACVASDPRTCGRNGMCNGNGACQLWNKNTMCEDQSCSAAQNTYYAAKMCDGAGSCKPQDNGSRTCFPNKCNGSACGIACGSSNDCVAPNECVNGRCGPKAIGAVCSADNQCDSGFCRQGVCCQTDCKSSCYSCALASTRGVCSAVPAGEQDPAKVCTADGVASCDRDGMCNGSGGCRLYAAGQVCAGATCVNGTATGVSKCDGKGECQKGAVRACDAYKCNSDGTACFESCTDNSQCVSPRVCVGTSCGAKPNGAECPNGASECQSGICVQGVCCNEACDGVCKTCKGTKAGTCSNVAQGAADPAGRCAPAAGAAVCGNDGTCNGNGACAKAPNTVVCRNQTCPADSNTFTRSARCDGAGNCPAPATVDCGSIKCDATSNACLTGCQNDGQCVSGNICDAATMSCGGLKPNGADCTANRQCASAKCVEGVCCGGLAADQNACPACQSCKIEGQKGTCRSAPAGAANAGACPAGTGFCGAQTCNGAGACVQANPAGTSCGAQTCVDGNKVQSQTCNASGMCVNGQLTTCEQGYRCADGKCKTSCTVATASTDCTAGNICIANRCAPPVVDGGRCAVNTDCVNGACINQICCNRACNGRCESCSAAGQCTVDAACLAKCTSNADCASNQMCDPSTMMCVAKVTKFPRGADCQNAGQCETGFCSQGVCCDSNCTGMCKTCAAVGVDRGICKNVPKTPELRCGTECSANKKTVIPLLCDGNGGCTAKGKGTDCDKNDRCDGTMCVPK